MSLHRYLKPTNVEADLQILPPEDADPETQPKRYRRLVKESALSGLVDLLSRTGSLGNERKLLADLIHRERKASTALGNGIAVPHVRTMQAKAMTVALARHREGIWFDAPGDEPVHLFFAVVAPPYDDQQYLKLYRSIGETLGDDDVRRALMEADDAHEMIRAIVTAHR